MTSYGLPLRFKAVDTETGEESALNENAKISDGNLLTRTSKNYTNPPDTLTRTGWRCFLGMY